MQTSEEKYFIDVPFTLKNKAKFNSAKYDKDVKKYFVEDKKVLPLFERLYLNVPFEDKQHAKENGCLFDKERKTWFTIKLNSDNENLKQYERLN